MIDDDSKYFSLSGDIRVGGPSTWHITDWDQRRVVSVTMDEEQDDESIAIEHFSRYSSQLSPNVYRIHVSDTGEIISMYTDPENDKTYCVHYPLLSEISPPPGVSAVRRDELEELERLGPDVDLVSYPPCSGASATKVVFKYYWQWQYAHMAWKEINLWIRLPLHPNIVTFDKIVLDELEGRVVGFTSSYVPGGNLEENKSRIFKLEWLKQLIEVVDLLNLRYGIVHQDISPRNLVVDDSTDSIKIFDFNFAARIRRFSLPEGERYAEDRNDVKGVIFTMYEIITQDYNFRSVPHEEQNLEDLTTEWVKHPGVKLDHPVASYQLLLQEWRELRAGNLHDAHAGEAPEAIDWPSRPQPPQRTILAMDANWQPFNLTVEGLFERRQDVQDRGDKVLSWERPPQKMLDNGTRVLSSGEELKCQG
ncbi:kinase-like domain-containing protein [Xylaria flabelliformis]|nr:kinase-like domain-containing protein [Xylaria flabelliformis]